MTTLERLKIKSVDSDARMPSVKQITKLLDELGIKYYLSKSTNVVEYRSKGNRYVNSRHDGKNGYLLCVGDIKMDTSDSYYSWSTCGYAMKLVKLIEEHNKNKKE
jgi:hypothetical protein